MVRTLCLFYDGDHRAHAHRIFDTQVESGIDSAGHFSAGQYTFTPEQDGQSIGLIHVADNKQDLLPKLDKQALQRFTPASEGSPLKCLHKKVNGLPLPKFVESPLRLHRARKRRRNSSPNRGVRCPSAIIAC